MAEEFQYQWTDNPTVSGVSECNTDVLNDCLMHLKYDKKDGGGAGLQMFDTILKDHVLTYEESKGLALQGSYVYKTAIAGSRYGYADFYNKCLAEKEAATATEVTLGENVITLYVHTNGHQFYDIADKETVDNWFSIYGTAWFYGVDTENERIFLPRNNYFVQATGDSAEVGQSVDAGLPNVEGTYWSRGFAYGAGAEFTGALSVEAYGGLGVDAGATDGGTGNYKLFLDASDSNPIYGNSDTVQPAAVKKLLYICVGNTEVQSSVTDVVDITTTENDTIPLFTGLYFDFAPNNASWLKAGEQANSGGIYATCYQELVNILNGETKYGDLKVIAVADMVEGEDYSEYWKVDQDNMTFITPSKISYSPINGDTASVVGNGKALGFLYSHTDGIIDGVLAGGLTVSGQAIFTGLQYNNTGGPVEIGHTGLGFAGLSPQHSTLGVSQDPNMSGLIADLTSAKSETAQLYFKVANAVQNLELLDVGRVMEEAVLKSHLVEGQVVIETYKNGSSWYRIWSDGWCEQGGYSSDIGTYSTVTLIKPYITTEYSVLITQEDSASPALGIRLKTENGFYFTTQTTTRPAYWQTKGYIK